VEGKLGGGQPNEIQDPELAGEKESNIEKRKWGKEVRRSPGYNRKKKKKTTGERYVETDEWARPCQGALPGINKKTIGARLSGSRMHRRGGTRNGEGKRNKGENTHERGLNLSPNKKKKVWGVSLGCRRCGGTFDQKGTDGHSERDKGTRT